MNPTDEPPAKDPLASVDRAKLLPLVRQALEEQTVEAVAHWQAQAIKPGGSGSGLYKLTGTAQTGAGTSPWSLVLKILLINDRKVVSQTEWKREALLYESGLLDTIPGGLRAVRCYSQESLADDEIWLWLEDVSEKGDGPWPPERHALAAYHLGQFNGSQLAQSLPSEAFLSRQFDRKYFLRDGHTIDPLLEALDQPYIKRVFTDDVLAAIHWLWEAREQIISHMYDRLPQCFGHLDTNRANLFSGQRPDGTEETIAIDWARSGIGPIGEDLRPMLTVDLAMRSIDIDMAQAAEYDRTVFAAYTEGMAASGWQGDPQLARYGFAATAAVFSLLRGAPLVPGLISSYQDGLFGLPYDEALDHLNTYLRLAAGWADEVRRLGPVLF
ncbi:MAG: phosphotransferase [Candidatus Latescibacteria bacterium]|nr:phosphotransferase [Candidatus Latescibacterota bacterium]